MTRLGWWWNRSWGTMTRRDVWLDQDDADRFVIRWRCWDLRDRDGLYRTADPAKVIAFLKALLGEDKSAWQEKLSL